MLAGAGEHKTPKLLTMLDLKKTANIVFGNMKAQCSYWNILLPPQDRVSIFHACKVPSMEIETYYYNFLAYRMCSLEAMMVGLIYLDRFFWSGRAGVPVDLLTIHRIMLLCCMMGSFIQDDSPYLCGEWAHIGGVGKKELVELQILFLQLTNHRLHVTETDFVNFVKYNDE
jgi:Cyclin